MANPYLDELLSRPTNLPTVPAVVQQILQTFGDDEVSLTGLGLKISADPVIAAKLLRLANSPFYRARREVRSVDDALQVLGTNTVRNVVLGCGLKEAFVPVAGLDLRGLWRHGVQTACAARWLARVLRHDAEFAFTVGLMTGIGQLLLHRAQPEQSARINTLVSVLAPGRAGVERRALHFHFAEVSAALAERWNLPATLAATLADVPFPLDANPPQPIAACVHLAAWSVWRCAPDSRRGSFDGDDVPVAVAASLGLSGTWWPEPLDRELDIGSPAESRVGRLPPLQELTVGLDELMG